MGIIKVKSVFLIFVICCSWQSVGQNLSKNEYQEAKRILNNEEYGVAYSAFNSLKEDPIYGSYSSFFAAYSLFKKNMLPNAIEEWQEVLMMYPNWEKVNDVLYWLTVANFQSGDLINAMQYLESYSYNTTTSSLSRQYVPQYLGDSEVDTLVVFYDLYPGNREVAQLLARTISLQPYGLRDVKLLEKLIQDFNFERSNLVGAENKNVFRTSYSVALVLPFMFESLENPNTVIRNTLIANFYQGILLGQTDLKEEGIELIFYNYDTQKDADITGSLLSELSEADLIVGPLYPDPIDTVRTFSRDNQINMINPLSSNSSYIGDNPFAFLFKPSYETMAMKLADYAVTQHNNKNVSIYFSANERDSIFAEIYKHRVEKDSFKVLDFRSLDKLTAKLLLDTFSETYEQIYTKDEADSIGEIAGRFVKSRKLKEAEILYNEGTEFDSLRIPFFFEEPDEGQELGEETAEMLVAYEMKLKVEKDSIGHIMIASRSSTIISNLISAFAAREDSTGLYGYGDWFGFRNANYELLEQLKVKIATSEYFDNTSVDYLELRNRFVAEFFDAPSYYHFMGYEFITYIGRMLNKHGKYFQNGFSKGYTKGVLMEGNNYSGSNDNQVVPIVFMEDLKIKPANNSQYEDRY